MTSNEHLLELACQALRIAERDGAELVPLQGRGSDRSYFRLRWRNDSVILVRYAPARVENAYFADIAGFLRQIGVPAPRVIHHDPAKCFIVVEDLGDTDLWHLRNAPWEIRRTLYKKTLAIAHRLHSFPLENFPATRVKLMDAFGPDLYRWEREYFRDHFVLAFCRIELDPSFRQEIELELHALAERLTSGARCLVHRDLQSQNTMIRNGEPFLIDFQGMRFGNPHYDLGSLLCDPYVSFSSEEREELLSSYFGLSKRSLDWTAFRNAFWEASAQRLMQALGAYGYLGLAKGLKSFLGHIPAGVSNLRIAAAEAGTLPRLRELAAECERASRCSANRE